MSPGGREGEMYLLGYSAVVRVGLRQGEEGTGSTEKEGRTGSSPFLPSYLSRRPSRESGRAVSRGELGVEIQVYKEGRKRS